METARCWQGISSAFRLTINDSMGMSFVDYITEPPLQGTVRSGTDRTPLFTFVPTWLDASIGKIEFTINGANTESLPVGNYLIQIKLQDGTADLCEAILDLGYSPGAALELPVYCSYQDILNHAPWVALLQNPDTDDTGFSQVRSQARNDIDTAIIMSYRGGGGQFGTHSDAGMLWAGGGVAPSDSIRNHLSDNKLMVQPKVVKMASYRSIAIIGLRQLVINPQHAAAGSLFQNMFLQELSSYVAEIDTDGSGTAGIVIPCVATNTVFV